MTPGLAKMISPAESDQAERSGLRNTREALWAMDGREIGREHQNKHGPNTFATDQTNPMQVLRSLSRDVMDPGRIAAPTRAEEEEQWMRHGVNLTAEEAWS